MSIGATRRDLASIHHGQVPEHLPGMLLLDGLDERLQREAREAVELARQAARRRKAARQAEAHAAAVAAAHGESSSAAAHARAAAARARARAEATQHAAEAAANVALAGLEQRHAPIEAAVAGCGTSGADLPDPGWYDT